jgi:hypothetical protein
MSTAQAPALQDLLDATAYLLAASGVIDQVPAPAVLAGLPAPAPATPPRTCDTDRRAVLLARCLGLGPVESYAGASGRWSTYVTDRHVVRVLLGPSPTVVARLQRVAELPGGPDLVAWSPDGEWVVERRHPGVTLRRAWPALSRPARRRCALELAGWRDRWAAVTPTLADVAAGVAEVAAQAASRLPVTVAAQVADHLTARPRWVHADLHAGNILVDPVSGTLAAVVDFEHAVCAGPAWDAVRLFAVAAYQTSPQWVASVSDPVADDLLTLALAAAFTPASASPGTARAWLRSALVGAAAHLVGASEADGAADKLLAAAGPPPPGWRGDTGRCM